jgi:hypothetical protein
MMTSPEGIKDCTPEPRVKFAMEHYTAETFEPYVGQVFEFDPTADLPGVAGNRVQLELLEVTRSTPAPGFRPPFALLFALRGPTSLGNGLHKIAHEDFEPCDWFVNRVVVTGRDPRTAYCQAVFG